LTPRPRQEQIVLSTQDAVELIRAMSDYPPKMDRSASNTAAILAAFEWAVTLDLRLNPRRLPFGHPDRIDQHYAGWPPRVRMYHLRVTECFDRILVDRGWCFICEDFRKESQHAFENVPVWKEKPDHLIREMAEATHELIRELEAMRITPSDHRDAVPPDKKTKIPCKDLNERDRIFGECLDIGMTPEQAFSFIKENHFELVRKKKGSSDCISLANMLRNKEARERARDKMR
jgi:hypothetical protein